MMPGLEGQVKDNSKLLYDTYCVEDTIPVAYIVITHLIFSRTLTDVFSPLPFSFEK